MFCVPRLGCPIVRRLHSHDDVRELFDSLRAEMNIHSTDVLFRPPLHAIGDNIKERQHADLGMVDHFLLFPKKGVGACRPRVD